MFFDSPGFRFVGTDEQAIVLTEDVLKSFRSGPENQLQFGRTYTFEVTICSATIEPTHVINDIHSTGEWELTAKNGKCASLNLPPGTYLVTPNGSDAWFYVESPTGYDGQ